jgi:branched-chain amino acid transport system permease protein
VFAVIIMGVVLFYRKGIMGDREFSLQGIANFFRRVFRLKKKAVG